MEDVSVFRSTTLAKNPQLKERKNNHKKHRKLSPPGAALSYSSFMKSCKPTLRPSGLGFCKSKSKDAAKAAMKKKSKFNKRKETANLNDTVFPTVTTISSTKRQLRENMCKALRSKKTLKDEEVKSCSIPKVELPEKIEAKVNKEFSLQSIASKVNWDTLKLFKRKFQNVCRELEIAYKVMHLSLYECNNKRKAKKEVENSKKTEIKDNLNAIHVLQNWVGDCICKLDRLDEIFIKNKENPIEVTSEHRDEIRSLLKFFENLPSAAQLETEICKTGNKENENENSSKSTIHTSSSIVTQDSSADVMGEAIGDVEEHRIILPKKDDNNSYAEFNFGPKSTCDGFIDILKVKEKREYPCKLKRNQKTSSSSSLKRKPKKRPLQPNPLQVTSKKSKNSYIDPQKKPKDVPASVEPNLKDQSKEDKYKNSLFFGQSSDSKNKCSICPSNKCTCQIITDTSDRSMSHRPSVQYTQIGFIQAKLSQIKDKDNYMSHYDMLDELQPKDLTPLQAEYPRKDYLKPATYLKATNTFLYDVLFNKNVNSKKLLKVRWEKWGQDEDIKDIVNEVQVMMVLVDYGLNDDVDKMKTIMKLAPYIFYNDDKLQYKFEEKEFRVMPVNVVETKKKFGDNGLKNGMKIGDCVKEKCNFCKKMHSQGCINQKLNQKHAEFAAKRSGTYAELLQEAKKPKPFPVKPTALKTSPIPKTVRLTATNKITLVTPKDKPKTINNASLPPPNNALQKLKQTVKNTHITSSEMKLVHGYLQEVIAIIEYRLFFALTLTEKNKIAEYAKIEKEIANVLNIIYPYYKRKDGINRLEVDKNSSHVLLEKLRNILSSDSSLSTSTSSNRISNVETIEKKIVDEKPSPIATETSEKSTSTNIEDFKEKVKTNYKVVLKELLETVTANRKKHRNISISIQTSTPTVKHETTETYSQETLNTPVDSEDSPSDDGINISIQTSSMLMVTKTPTETLNFASQTDRLPITNSTEAVLSFLDNLTKNLTDNNKNSTIGNVPKIVQCYLNSSAYEAPVLHLATLYYQSCGYHKAYLSEQKKMFRLKKLATNELLPCMYILLFGLVYAQFFISSYKCH